MKAKTLLALTAGQHALQAALCAKLESALSDRYEAQQNAQYMERCLREVERHVLPQEVDQRPSEPLWPGGVVRDVTSVVDTLRGRIAQLETDLSAACAKVRQ